jgi:hypothetical protein
VPLTAHCVAIKRAADAVARIEVPWSPEFMAAYHKLMEQKTAPVLHIGSDRVIARSIRALAIAYYDGATFKALKANSQGVRRNIIERFCRETGKAGQPYGDKSAVTMKCHDVEKLMEGRADKPESANGLRKALREMMKVAVKWSGAKTIRPWA